MTLKGRSCGLFMLAAEYKMSIMALLITCSIIGLIPAFIAREKGRGFFIWWIYGALLFIIALVHSLAMPNMKTLQVIESQTGARKKCPECSELVQADAKICRYCNLRFDKELENSLPPSAIGHYVNPRFKPYTPV